MEQNGTPNMMMAAAPTRPANTLAMTPLSMKPRLPSLNLDIPPPVPPKDVPSRPPTASASASASASAASPQTAFAFGSRPGTAASTTRTPITTPLSTRNPGLPGRFPVKVAPIAERKKTIGPSIAGTMSAASSRPGTSASISNNNNIYSTATTPSFGPPKLPPPARGLPQPPPSASASRPGTSSGRITPPSAPPSESATEPTSAFEEEPSSRTWTMSSMRSTVSNMKSATLEKGRQMSASTIMTSVSEKKAAWYGSERRQRQRRERPVQEQGQGQGQEQEGGLVPQPSEDERDPLNWPIRKKDVTLFALLTAVATSCATKTILIPITAPLAAHLAVSPTSAAALTGAPLILSTLASHASLALSKLYGKRPVYLGSVVLLLCGCAATASPSTSASHGGLLAARIFQGFGWGALDVLPLASIHDMYFEHERRPRLAALDILIAFATWGSPLFAGVAARDAGGEGAGAIAAPFRVAVAFATISLLCLLFAAPETAYDRWFSGSDSRVATPMPPQEKEQSSQAPTQTQAQSQSQSKTPQMETKELNIGRLTINLPIPNAASAKAYLKTIKPASNFRGFRDSRTLLQAPRALIAPTTVLLAFLAFLPTSALWGLTHLMSLLFAPSTALDIDPSQVGALLAAPFVLVLALLLLFVAKPRLCTPSTTRTDRDILVVLAVSTVLIMIGTLAFGLEIHSRSDALDSLSLPLLSILLGFLALGTYYVSSLVRPMTWRAARSNTSNPHVCLRVVADMDAGVGVWRTFFAGVFVIGVANAVEMATGQGGEGGSTGSAAAAAAVTMIWGTMGLRGAVIGITVAQILAAGLVAAVWWFLDDKVLRLDGRVMGLVDLGMLKRSGSFFDHD